MTYRQGNLLDLQGLKRLALRVWNQFQHHLTEENWQKLFSFLNNDNTYMNLLEKSYCLVCESEQKEIIGMSFLVSSGNPTEIFDKSWAYFRMVAVDENFSGQGIGRKLINNCIQYAIKYGERTNALHASEMMHVARHLYESLGFRILNEIEPRLGKKYWLYTLQLDAQ